LTNTKRNARITSFLKKKEGKEQKVFYNTTEEEKMKK